MSLFNKDAQESYTELAKELETELTQALLPIFKKYADQGVKQRELFYCAVQVAQDVQLSALVEADRQGATDFECCACGSAIAVTREGCLAGCTSPVPGHFDFGRSDPRQIVTSATSIWCEACDKHFVPE